MSKYVLPHIINATAEEIIDAYHHGDKDSSCLAVKILKSRGFDTSSESVLTETTIGCTTSGWEYISCHLCTLQRRNIHKLSEDVRANIVKQKRKCNE